MNIDFLEQLLDAVGPSGFELEPARVWRAEAETFASVETDVHGNSVALLNPQGKVHHIFGYGGFLRTHYATQNILVRQWLLRRLGVTQLMTGQYKKALHTAWEMKRFTAKTRISQNQPYGEYTLLALAASRAHFLNTGSWLDISGLESDTASLFNPKRTYNRF